LRGEPEGSWEAGEAMTFVEALLAASGCTLCVTQGSLFRFIQNRSEFFRCSLCTGVWIGGAVGLAGWFTGELATGSCLSLPFATSFVASIAAHLTVAAHRVGSEPIQVHEPAIDPAPQSEIEWE
jgi:hypothetical protein